MTVAEVYEKYRHLDHLLSDPQWMPSTFMGAMLHECWEAIKASQPVITEAKEHDQ